MTEPTGKKASTRLQRLSVHAVAFVDEGANLARWAEVRKAKARNDMGDATGGQAGTAFPAEAQATLTDQLGKVCEGLMAILDFVKSAPASTDPAAVVPPEICERLEQFGMMLMGLGDQFEAPAPGAPGDVQMTADMLAAEKTLAKTVVVGMRETAKTLVAKGGKVRMSAEQFMKLHTGLVSSVYDLLKQWAPLMNDMGEGEEESTLDALAPKKPVAAGPNGAASDPPAPATEPPAAEKALETMQKSIDALNLKFDRIGKTRGPSNAAPLDPPPPAPAEPTVHGRNLSKEFRTAKAAKATNGAPSSAAGA